jgi:ribosomal protein S18 acetylase RimI-like enzyme
MSKHGSAARTEVQPTVAAGPDAPASHARAPAPRWLPIRTLAVHHRSRILIHLLALDARDRQLRFGHAASDAHIARYVQGLDFARDEVLGVFDRRLRLVAMAHLAFPDPACPGSDAQAWAATGAVAEFGVSVSPRLRRRGIGASLFERAALHARNRGVEHLVVHALSENAAMLALAHRAGAPVTCEGADSTAVLRLPAEDLASHCQQALGSRAGAVDDDFKRRARQLGRMARTARHLAERSMLKVCAPHDAPGKPQR